VVSPGTYRCQRAASPPGMPIRPRRHRLHAHEYRRETAIRFTTWNQVVGLHTTA
jgi:hypothetical protein